MRALIIAILLTCCSAEEDPPVILYTEALCEYLTWPKAPGDVEYDECIDVMVFLWPTMFLEDRELCFEELREGGDWCNGLPPACKRVSP